MSSADWNRTKAIFHSACDLPSEERRSFVYRECGDDAELIAEVLSLLDTLDQGLHGQAIEATRTLGPYRLLKQIGEGGFGTVWRAEQTGPLAREVAVKTIKPGMDSQQIIARFQQERQSLAMMDHPGIAKVFDAGTDASGRPYFAMELVVGEPITAYCRKHNLTVRQRLELLLEVVLAVQHAHQKGVIHRDLKPTNILVCLVDNVPRPKIIDFGIAKALGESADSAIKLTAEQQMIGTIQYMSPEQAAGSSDLDTRVDIFSLGVLLYEMLTGKTPLDAESQGKSRAMLRQAAIDADFKSPSTQLGHSSGDGRSVRGELDWIVMKCLEKDRSRRYDSAGALADDLRRHLAGEAVRAAPPSRLYRLRKFSRRNRATLVSAGLVMSVIAAGTVIYIRGITAEQQRTRAALQLADQQRDLAEGQRKIAEQQTQIAREQAAIAKAVSDFQLEVLANPDPAISLGSDITLRQFMEASVKQLDENVLKDQPALEAALRSTIGESLNELGAYDRAEAQFKRAMALQEQARPVDEIGLAQSLQMLGVIAKLQERFDVAEPLYRRSLEIRRRVLSDDDPALARVMNNLASLYQDTNREEDARAMYEQALVILRRRPASQMLTTTLNNLATLKVGMGQMEEATTMMEEVLQLRRQLLAPEHPLVGQSLSNLSFMYMMQPARVAEAEKLVRESLEIRRRVLPAGHLDIASSAANLGMCVLRQGRAAEAEPLLRESLAVRKERLGKDSRLTQKNAQYLVQALTELGRPEEAAAVSAEFELK
jgi:eukaryotic-like serine/threonine-protein kinase